MADTHFAPLKREPLLEEELPAANPTVRLIKGAKERPPIEMLSGGMDSQLGKK
jgi:hypothetical protein